MTDKKLKSCPFCGNDVDDGNWLYRDCDTQNNFYPEGMSETFYFISCQVCGAQGPKIWIYGDDGTQGWNERRIKMSDGDRKMASRND